MFCQLFSLQNKSFLCLQHVENKGFQTVIKHRLKAIQNPIKNELGNREKNTKNAHFVLKKCTFRFRDYTCREGNVLHHYLFNDEKLTIVVSHVKKLENTVSYFLDAANSMDERYKRLTSVGNNIHWYQEYKQQIYIASVEDEQNKDWYFFYSPSKELIEKNIERYKR